MSLALLVLMIRFSTDAFLGFHEFREIFVLQNLHSYAHLELNLSHKVQFQFNQLVKSQIWEAKKFQPGPHPFKYHLVSDHFSYKLMVLAQVLKLALRKYR